MTDDLRAAAERVLKNRGPIPWGKRQMDYQALASPDRILALLDENKELRAALEGQRESQLHRLQHARPGSMGYAEIEEELAEIGAALVAREPAPSSMTGEEE